MRLYYRILLGDYPLHKINNLQAPELRSPMTCATKAYYNRKAYAENKL